MQWDSVLTASRGHPTSFSTLLSLCRPLCDTFKERLLCASLRGHHDTIVDLVISIRPNVNPSHYSQSPHDTDWGDVKFIVNTAPLAGSLRGESTGIIGIFLSACVFSSLHERGRSKTTLKAAVETGDHILVTRLLDYCPDLELHRLQITGCI